MSDVACFSLSIDLGPTTNAGDLVDDRSWAQITRQLLQLTRRYSLVATWALADPGAVRWIEPVRNDNAHSEIALLADRTWVQPTTGVRQFVRELQCRTERARAAGIPLNMLAMHDGQLREHAHLLPQAGISVLRTAGSPSTRLSGTYAPPTYRQGICKVTTTARIPGRATWSLPLVDRGPVRLLQTAIQQNSALHFTIDAVRFAQATAAGHKQLERLLAVADAARQAGKLQISTLGRQARALSAGPTRRQARSILRAA